jgi:hypothetical protein
VLLPLYNSLSPIHLACIATDLPALHVSLFLDIQQMKRVFLDGNPYLLALTMCVSMLHSVFDFLAFKNDIGFWKENKSMEGLSARSIVINAVCQLVSNEGQAWWGRGV